MKKVLIVITIIMSLRSNIPIISSQHNHQTIIQIYDNQHETAAQRNANNYALAALHLAKKNNAYIYPFSQNINRNISPSLAAKIREYNATKNRTIL
jgi:hypothetical protein